MKVSLRRIFVYAGLSGIFWLSIPSFILLTHRKYFADLDSGTSPGSSYPPLLDPFCANFVSNVNSEFYLNYTATHLFFDIFPRNPRKPSATMVHFAINSAPGNFQARRTVSSVLDICITFGLLTYRFQIRATWKRLLSTSKSSSCSGTLLFYVGKTKNAETAQWLAREIKQHPDDMVVIDFCDAYENLPLKTANMMKHVHENYPDTEWVVKLDDDMMPNLPGFYQCFPKVVENGVDIYGWITIDAVPDRGTKYQVSAARYGDAHFPPFAHGPAYAVRVAQIGKLLAVAESVPIVNLEDVWFTGMLAQKVGIKRKNVTHFLSMRRKPFEFDMDMEKVVDKALFFHSISVRIIRKAWANLPQSCEKAKKYDCVDFTHGIGGFDRAAVL